MQAAPTIAAVDAEARDHVRRVVAASRTSFLQGMRVLPEARREAMYAIYAFCREIDDIADEPAPPREKIARLEEWRNEIDRLYDDRPRTLTGRALLPHRRAYGLDRADFLALIAGMEMDAAEDICAPSFAQLELYCDRVAGAVGRLSVRVFGAREPESDIVARELGLALQLTNILRDLDEDAARNRLYLPVELLDANQISARDPAAVLAHPGLGAVCAALADRARRHYAAAAAAMRRCARRPMRPAAIMMTAYRAVLSRLERRGWRQRDAPVKLPRPLKLWIALRHGLV